MAIVINGSGTITGVSTGGLPDGIVDADMLATDAVTSAKILDGTIANGDVNDLAASKLTGALPAISGASLTGLPAGGKVLQIVSLNTNSYVNTSSSTPIATPLTLSITPSLASSKVFIKISANGFGCAASVSTKVNVQLYKNGSHYIWMADYYGYGQVLHAGSMTWDRLDSPATTSATTYTMYMASDGGTNCDFNNHGISGRTSSTITLMEIAA